MGHQLDEPHAVFLDHCRQVRVGVFGNRLQLGNIVDRTRQLAAGLKD